MAIIIATTVTQRVPIMKGKRPNSPFRGCQEDEKSSVLNGWIDRIGFAFRKRPIAIRTTSKAEKTVADNIRRLARRSFSLLRRIPLSSPGSYLITSLQSVTLPAIHMSAKVCLFTPLVISSSRTGLSVFTTGTTASLVTETQNAPFSISAE